MSHWPTRKQTLFTSVMKDIASLTFVRNDKIHKVAAPLLKWCVLMGPVQGAAEAEAVELVRVSFVGLYGKPIEEMSVGSSSSLIVVS